MLLLVQFVYMPRWQIRAVCPRWVVLSIRLVSRRLFLAIVRKHDVIHKPEVHNIYRIEDRGTARGNMRTKFDKDWMYGSGNMLADRQTDTQTDTLVAILSFPTAAWVCPYIRTTNLRAAATLSCHCVQTAQRTCVIPVSMRRTRRWLATSAWRHQVTTVSARRQASARRRATLCDRSRSVSACHVTIRSRRRTRATRCLRRIVQQ